MLAALSVGEILTCEVGGYAQEQMNAYGRAVGTYGAMHTDPEFAKTTPQGTTIVQGMLVLAPLDRLMSQLVGAARWRTQGRVETKVVGMTRPDQPTHFELTVLEVSPDHLKVAFTVRTTEATVLVGEASA